MQSLFYGSGFLISALTLWGFYLGEAWTFTGFFILFGVVSGLDLLKPNFKIQASLTKSPLSDFWLLISPIYLTFSLFYSGYLFLHSTSTVEKWGLVLSEGTLLGALGITIAHELIHRSEKWQRALGVWNLQLVHFGHWGVEHVFGHHKNVATPLDSATARLNQNLYQFWIQNYFGGFKSAWEFEAQRSKSLWQNRIIHYLTFSVVLIAAVFFMGSYQALFFWFFVSFVATVLLLSVDYIEHYGLLRQQKENGLYEPVKPQHSWDSGSFFTNVILLNLGLHTHHHLKARLPFQQLQANPESRQMPYGYSVMVALAFVPPLYFKLMNPKILNTETRSL